MCFLVERTNFSLLFTKKETCLSNCYARIFKLGVLVDSDFCIVGLKGDFSLLFFFAPVLEKMDVLCCASVRTHSLVRNNSVTIWGIVLKSKSYMNEIDNVLHIRMVAPLLL